MLKKLNKYFNISIVIAIIFAALGIILMSYPDISFNAISYCIAGILIINGLVLFVVDVVKGFNKSDEIILDKLKEEKADVILVLNKVDKIKKDELYNLIMDYKDKYNFDEIIPVSALKDKNIDELLNTIKSYLNEGELLFDNEHKIENLYAYNNISK